MEVLNSLQITADTENAIAFGYAVMTFRKKNGSASPLWKCVIQKIMELVIPTGKIMTYLH